MSNKYKPTLCIDFDGVIHSYEKGWQNGDIYGSVVPGFFEWVERVRDQFKLVIYSSRSKDPNGTLMMATWLRLQAERVAPNWQCTDMPTREIPVQRFLDAQRAEILLFRFAHEKPPAWLTIDDRAICFKGDWNAPELQSDALSAFKPWNVS
jgi:Swiss Army Knife RNA repair-like protein